MDLRHALRRVGTPRALRRLCSWLTILSLTAGPIGPFLPVAHAAAPSAVASSEVAAEPAAAIAPGTRLPQAAQVARGQVPPPDSELTELRTQSSRTYLTTNGYRAVVGLGAVNYRDASGAWQPIDNTLVANGAFFQNRANGFVDFLPQSVEMAPVRVAKGSSYVDFQLAGARAPAAVGGETATYANALPGVNASYTATATGLKEKLTLASAAAPSTFTFALRTSPDLTARGNAAGGVDFVDGSGRAVLAFAPPFMYDARGARSLAVTLRLGQGTVVLAADARWLADPARAWPVVVDPEVVVGPNPQCAIQSATPTINICGGATLPLGYDGVTVSRQLAQFDLSGVPAMSTVTDSVLVLHEAGVITAGSHRVEVRRPTRAWTSAATWNTYDGTNSWTTPGGDYDTSVVSDHSEGSDGAYYFDIPALMQQFLWGQVPYDGLLFKAEVETNNKPEQIYGPTSANPPQLFVDYEPYLGAKPYYPMFSQHLSDRMAGSINIATGNFYLSATDLVIKGTGVDLSLARAYNNQDRQNRGMGARWRLTDGSDVYLDVEPTGVELLAPTGWSVFFPQNANGSFAAPPGMDATLVKNADGTYTLTFHASGSQWKFGAQLNGSVSGTLHDGDDALLNQIVDRNGNAVTFAHSTDGTVSTVTDTQGRVTTFHKESHGFVDQITDPTGRVYAYAYDPTALIMTSYTDPANQTTTYGYDTQGNITSIADPIGNKTTLTYDASYRVTSFTRVTNNTTGAGYTWTFTYNSGNTVVTDPNNHASTYSFDVQGRGTQVTDALGHSRSVIWNADNHVQTTTDAYGKSTSYSYDAAGERLTQIQVPTGAHTSYAYTDANHPYLPTSTTDPQGNTTTYAYDAAGNLHSVTTPLTAQNLSTINHNANGTVSSVVDYLGNTTSYGYDAHGNLTSVTPPAPLGQVTITPDGLSRRGSMRDGKGQTTSYSYDVLDRLTKVTYADTSAVSTTPDAVGNVLSMVDNTGTTSYGYDRLNRQVTKTLPSGALTCTVSLPDGTVKQGSTCSTFDGVSNLLSVADAGGTVGYRYNAADLVDQLTEPDAAITTFAYDNNNHRTSTTYPNGVVMNQTYDDAQRIGSVVADKGSTHITNFAYSHAKPGTNPPQDSGLWYQITDGVAGTTTTQTFDVLNRLTEWKVMNGGSQVHDYLYHYDGNSNRTYINADGSETTLNYNAASEWTTAVTTAGTATYSWDANGQMLGNDGRGNPSQALTITYNAKNQLASITDTNATAIPFTYTGPNQTERVAAGTSTYAYTGLGLSSTAASPPIYYVRDPSGRLVAQRKTDSSNNVTKYYYVLDAENSVRALTDALGNVAARYDYCPTGNPADGNDPAPGTVAGDNPFRKGSNFYDYRFKDYFGPDGEVSDSNSGVHLNVGYINAGDTGAQAKVLSQARDLAIKLGADAFGIEVMFSGGWIGAGRAGVDILYNLKTQKQGNFFTVGAGLGAGERATGSGLVVFNSPTNSDFAGPFVNLSTGIDLGPGVNASVFSSLPGWGKTWGFSFGPAGEGASVEGTVTTSVLTNEKEWDIGD